MVWCLCKVWMGGGGGECEGEWGGGGGGGGVNMMANESGYSGLLSCGVVLRGRLSDSGSGMLRMVWSV